MIRTVLTVAKTIPVLKSPSGMKNAPTVIPTSTRNLKNQKLRGKKKINVIPSMYTQQTGLSVFV